MTLATWTARLAAMLTGELASLDTERHAVTVETTALAKRRILLDAALSYTESSPQFRIFPAHPMSKRPLISTGRDHAEHASTDPAKIARWLLVDFPACAIGAPTGAASGIVVIDADAKHDGEALLAELEAALGPLPRERVARTQSGGLHIYLSHPGEGIRVKSGQGADSALGRLLCGRPGIDVRADGGMVVLPPSPGYRWIADDDGPLPVIPPMWLAAIQGVGEPPPPPPPPLPRNWAASDRRWSDPERGDSIAEGGRSGALYRRGVALHMAGATDSELHDDLLRANASRCRPPLPEHEVARIAASAARATGRRA
jgi:hypothetical protein